MHDDERVAGWLEALERRHLADLTTSEVARALRALSSCYVERRAKLARGGALDGAGKRAAFALFYAPLHFLVVREIVRAIDSASSGGKRRADSRPRVRYRRRRGRVGARVRPLRGRRRRSPCVGGRGSQLDVPHAGPGRTRQASRCRSARGARRKRTGDSRGLHRQRAPGRDPRRAASAPDRRARTRLPHPHRRTDRAPNGRVVDGVGRRLHGCRRDRRGMAVRHTSTRAPEAIRPCGRAGSAGADRTISMAVTDAVLCGVCETGACAHVCEAHGRR